jgi:hypothetical protein
MAPESFDFTRANRRLTAARKEHGIGFLGLLDGFVALSKLVRLYKHNDTHWNIKGNAVAAELIERHLAPQVSRRPH